MNNITLLRLIFALQVFYVHAYYFLELYTIDYLSYFPGVPAFFFVCGYLIYGSAKRHHFRVYVRNRFFRIYPALCIVTCATMIFLLLPLIVLTDLSELLLWLFANLTLFQQYNPTFFREFGVGVINGALWTLSIEIIVYFIIFFITCSKYTDNAYFLTLSILVSLMLFYVIRENISNVRDIVTFWKYIKLSPLYWWWMFAIGILFYKYDIYLRNKKGLIIIGAVVYVLFTIMPSERLVINANEQSLIVFFCYACFIYSLAFVIPLKLKIPDISYGIYIYHMPVINFVLIYKLHPLLVFPLVIFFAWMSYFFVERKYMKVSR